MKKIFHVTNQIRGGAIPHILRDLHPYMGRDKVVHLVALQKIFRTDKVVQELEDLGVVLHELRANQYDLIGTLLKLRKFFRVHNPDIVHAHLGRPEILCPFAVGGNCKLFSTTHNMKSGYNFIARLLLPITQRYLAKRFFVSNEVKKSWGADGKANSVTLYNPISQNYFIDNWSEASSGDLIGEKEKFVFLNIGRLTKQKAHEDILRASYLLKEKIGNTFSLKIAGRGPLQQYLTELTEELSLTEQVDFLCFRDDVSRLFSDSDCFVFSSHWEGFGLAMLEAIAAGLPVIRSDIQVLNEVAPSELVKSYPVGDIQLLSERMYEAISDKSNSTTLAINAREWSLRFSAQQIALQLQNHYDDALREAKPFNDKMAVY